MVLDKPALFPGVGLVQVGLQQSGADVMALEMSKAI